MGVNKRRVYRVHKIGIVGVLLVVALLILGACAPTPAPTPTPTPTPTPAPDIIEETYLTLDERIVIANRNLNLLMIRLDALTQSQYGKIYLANFFDTAPKTQAYIVVDAVSMMFLGAVVYQCRNR